MAIYAIGDLHLSFGVEKPMDIFGGWENHVEILTEKWNSFVKPDDTVVVMGDVSWGLDFSEALPDFKYINDKLNGRKLVMKGNHDYWWATMAKLQAFKAENCLDAVEFLFNNSFAVEGLQLCGTRGWTMDGSDPDELKIILREAGRLERSLSSAGEGEKVVFLHYPPIQNNNRSAEIINVMERHGVTRCYYGHLHGVATAYAVNRTVDGIAYKLLSADALGFCPYKIV